MKTHNDVVLSKVHHTLVLSICPIKHPNLSRVSSLTCLLNMMYYTITERYQLGQLLSEEAQLMKALSGAKMSRGNRYQGYERRGGYGDSSNRYSRHSDGNDGHGGGGSDYYDADYRGDYRGYGGDHVNDYGRDRGGYEYGRPQQVTT